MTSLGVLYVDGSDDYHRIRLPRNWRVHYEPEWRGLQGSLQWCLERFPDASQYGWLADDTRPRTRGWDTSLERAAGGWNLAYAKDLWMSEDPIGLEALRAGRDLSSGLCWGGDLIRTVGWWALPQVKQAGIDTAWTEITRPFALHRYLEDIVVEHLHYKAGKRPKDHVDDGAHIPGDVQKRNRWVWSADYRNTLRRLAALIPSGDPVTEALRQSLIDELWGSVLMPAARLKRIQEGALHIDIDQYETEVQRSHPHVQPPRVDPPCNTERGRAVVQ